MINTLTIQGYRSLKDVSLRFSKVSIIQGGNGVGKSNVYKALGVLSSLVHGDFAEYIADDGGTESCLWAGERLSHELNLEMKFDLSCVNFGWKFECGKVPVIATYFNADPDIKREVVSTASGAYSRNEWRDSLSHIESLFNMVDGEEQYLSVSHAKEEISRWRFYDCIRTDAESPARRPAKRYWSPILNESADNLASVLQTIKESGKDGILDHALAEAYPDHRLEIIPGVGTLSIAWHHPDLKRPLSAKELSDGTLKYIALCAALLSPKQPPVIILNEPENSLNPSLYKPLVSLIKTAGESSQIILISHSSELAAELKLVEDVKVIELVLEKGATRLREDLGAKKVRRFD